MLNYHPDEWGLEVEAKDPRSDSEATLSVSEGSSFEDSDVADNVTNFSQQVNIAGVVQYGSTATDMIELTNLESNVPSPSRTPHHDYNTSENFASDTEESDRFFRKIIIKVPRALDEFDGIIVRGIPPHRSKAICHWVSYVMHASGYDWMKLDIRIHDAHLKEGDRPDTHRLYISSKIPHVYKLVKQAIIDQPWYNKQSLLAPVSAIVDFKMHKYFEAFATALRIQERIVHTRKYGRRVFREFLLARNLEGNFRVKRNETPRKWVKDNFDQIRERYSARLQQAYIAQNLQDSMVREEDSQLVFLLDDDKEKKFRKPDMICDVIKRQCENLGGWPEALVEFEPQLLVMGMENLRVEIFDPDGRKCFEVTSAKSTDSPLVLHITWDGVRCRAGHPTMCLWGQGARSIHIPAVICRFLALFNIWMTFVVLQTAFYWLKDDRLILGIISLSIYGAFFIFYAFYVYFRQDEIMFPTKSKLVRFFSFFTLVSASVLWFQAGEVNCRIIRHEVIVKVYPQVILHIIAIRHYDDGTLNQWATSCLICWIAIDSVIHRFADMQSRIFSRFGNSSQSKQIGWKTLILGGLCTWVINMCDTFLRFASVFMWKEAFYFLPILGSLFCFEWAVSFCILIRDSYPYLCIMDSRLSVPLTLLFRDSLIYATLAMFGEYNFKRIPLGNNTGVMRVERYWRFFTNVLLTIFASNIWGWPRFTHTQFRVSTSAYVAFQLIDKLYLRQESDHQRRFRVVT